MKSMGRHPSTVSNSCPRRSHLTPFASGLVLLLLLAGCATTSPTNTANVTLVDREATRPTKALYANLRLLAEDHLLFGHQDDLAYGVNWKREKGRSDVHDVAGAYPAVYGWELGDLENGVEANLDTVNFKEMQGWIKEGYKRGGIITISWHMDNPVSRGSSWDTTRAVYSILPGGVNHALYRHWLDRFADFVGGLKTGPLAWLGLGKPVPIIFRPFHEHSGGWFWWGRGHVTPDEYVRLWRFTVEYLRDEKNLHNLIYAYSTDVFDSEEQYLEHYPGDDYVDVLGYDDYRSLRSDESVSEMTARLRTLVRLAEARGKIAALTETGSEGVRSPTWWTGRLLRAIESDPISRRIAWVLVWRNANARHHYAPYAGHPSAADFIEFYKHPFVLFGDGLPDLYH